MLWAIYIYLAKCVVTLSVCTAQIDRDSLNTRLWESYCVIYVCLKTWSPSFYNSQDLQLQALGLQTIMQRRTRSEYGLVERPERDFSSHLNHKLRDQQFTKP